MKTLPTFVVALSLFTGALAHADDLLGNLPSPIVTSSGTRTPMAVSTSNNNTGKAIGFEVGSTAFNLEDVQLVLNVPATANLTVSLYAATSSTNAIPTGSALATFTDATLSLTPSTPADYTFTDSSDVAGYFALQANTAYDLVVVNSAAGSANQVLWYYTSPSAPSSPVSDATGIGAILGPSNSTVTDPTLWTTTSATYNEFELDGVTPSASPEPSTVALMAVSALGVLLFRACRRSRTIC